MEKKFTRCCSHAGSWYAGEKNTLTKNIIKYFDKVKIKDEIKNLKGIISP